MASAVPSSRLPTKNENWALTLRSSPDVFFATAKTVWYLPPTWFGR